MYERVRQIVLAAIVAAVAPAGVTAQPSASHADVDAVKGIIAHLAQALTMEAMAPAHGASPRVQLFAAELEIAQRAKVEALQAWLKAHGEAVSVVSEAHAGHDHGVTGAGAGAGAGAAEHAQVAGMLTEDQLEELAHARGVRFDRLFLTYLIQHHQGGIVTGEKLGSAGGDVSAVARSLVADEKALVIRMQAMSAP